MQTRRQIKDMNIVLKDFEPMVRNPQFLRSGREIPNFSLRPREAWANWLLCVVLRKVHNTENITFAEDNVCDGLLIDDRLGIAAPTEHVSALDIPDVPGAQLPSGEQRVIDAINLKIARGADYAEGKFLVVFFDGAGTWYRPQIREAIKGRHNFKAVFGIGLLTSDEEGYAYSVTQFFEESSVTFKVQINSDFTGWTVEQIQ